MIRVECPSCGARLKVKDVLGGRSGKCPGCGKSVAIPAPAKAPAASDAVAPIPFDSVEDDEPTPRIIVPEGRGTLGTVVEGDSSPPPEPKSRAVDVENAELFSRRDAPERLGALSHYLICDHKDVVARWQNDGKGWMIRLKDGFTRAATVSTEIPSFGKFILIEIGCERRGDGIHLSNISPYRLQPTYALTKLTKGDDTILTSILRRAPLNNAQKSHVRTLVKSKFLPHMWPVMDTLIASVQGE